MLRRVGTLVGAFALVASTSVGAAATAAAGTTSPVRARIERLFDRGRSALQAHATTAPAGAAPLTKAGVNDPVGDAGDTRADITHVGAYYSATALDLSLKVAQPTNPSTDANWRSSTALVGTEWGIDTTGDSNPEYIALFAAGAAGRLVADIVPENAAGLETQVCKGAKARFDHGSYIVTATPSCVGNAAHIWVGAFMIYIPDLNGNSGGIDTAPDRAFFGPCRDQGAGACSPPPTAASSSTGRRHFTARSVRSGSPTRSSTSPRRAPSRAT